MRRLAYLMMMMAGCGGSTPNPCSGQSSGVCINARIEGNATGLTQLSFRILAAMPLVTTSPNPPAGFSLPVLVGLLLPSDRVDGNFDIECDGLSGSDTIASDTESLTTANKKGSVTFTLDSGSIPDLSTPNLADMVMQPDLLKPSPMLVPSPAMPMGRELEPLSFIATGSDPLNLSPSTAMSMLPTGATATTGAVSMFNWTPHFTQAGTYNIAVTTTTSDSRSIQIMVPVTIANSVDPVPALNPADVTSPNAPTFAIGDFDGDGFGDVASCTVLGMNVYNIFILYGDASGLPPTMTIPGGRTKTYTFNALSQTNTANNTRLPCTGADMDGDGKSDIILQDPGGQSNLAPVKGQIYIFFGTDRANATSSAVSAVDPNNTGEKFTGQIFVGHYSAGNKADFAIATVVSANEDRINIYHGNTRPVGTTWPAPEIRAITNVAAPPNTKICVANRSIIGFADFDGNANNLDELLVWDKNVASPSSGECVNHGGFAIMSSTVSDKLFERPRGASNNNFGQNVSVFCDVDGDGKADLVVATDGNTNTDSNAQIYLNPFPIATPSPVPVLDVAGAKIIANTPPRVYQGGACIKKFVGNSPFNVVLLDGGDAVNAARLDVIGPTNPPSVIMSVPTPDASDKAYGRSFGGSCDINGDGKGDIVVGAPMGKYWSVYGR